MLWLLGIWGRRHEFTHPNTLNRWAECAKEKASSFFGTGLYKIPGDDLLSPRRTTIGRAGLASVFGMGTGVSPPVWSPGNSLSAIGGLIQKKYADADMSTIVRFLDPRFRRNDKPTNQPKIDMVK